MVVEAFPHVVVLAILKSQNSTLHIGGERDELLGEHVVKELVQCLILFLA